MKLSFYLYSLFIFSPVLVCFVLALFVKSRNNVFNGRFGIFELIIILVVDFGFKFLSIVLYGYGFIDLKILLTYFSIGQYLFELVLVFFMFKFRFGRNLSEVGFVFNGLGKQLLSGLFVLPFEIVLYSFYYIRNGYLDVGYYFKFSDVSPHVFYMSLFTMLFIGPIAEEVVFRGVAIPAIKQKVGPVWTCVLTSYFWSIYHPRLDLIITSFFLGILYFYLYEKHKSLFPSLCAHFLHNLIFVILAFAQ